MSTSYYKPNDSILVFIQSRAEVDPATVEEYAAMMADGISFDPVEAVTDGGKIYVWDGFHRGEAAKKTGTLLFVKMRPGTYEEAQWLALGANQKHGLRRSNADKQKIVKLALLHPNGAQMSDRQIAAHVGVHHDTVAKFRKELEVTGEIASQTERTGADGRTIDTANIGLRFHCKYWHCPSQGNGFPVDGETGVCKKCGAQHEGGFSGMQLKPGEPARLDAERRERMAALQQNAEIKANWTEQWRARRSELVKTLICFACGATLNTYGDRDAVRCTGCGRSWHSVADFRLRQAEEENEAAQDGDVVAAEIEADRSESRYDFTNVSTEQIERDLTALENAGYGDGDMAARLREELAERYDNEELLEKGLPPCPCNTGANISISTSGVICGCGAKWTAEGWIIPSVTAEAARMDFAYKLNRRFWDIIRPLSREQLYEIERRLDALSEQFSPGKAVEEAASR